MRVIYVVFDKKANKEILCTPNRMLAYKLFLRNEMRFKMYMRKERI